MVADFGYGILIIAFLVAIYSAVAAVIGARSRSYALVESARRAMLLTWPLISLSAAALIYLLVNDHYEVSFVYEVTSRSMPTYLKITAWWGGQAGSLIFWSWLMAAFASLVTLRNWDRDREFLPWVILVTSITVAFFLAMSVFFENPFSRMWFNTTGEMVKAMVQPAGTTPVPLQPDGRGLNPLLRHPGMIIHPPLLYLGFVSFVIPFAFAIASLITGRTDDRWIRVSRRWTLWAWCFLAFGLVLGGRWAYDVLGWGGYWGWDPVEIAAFMPWLTGTAFLHSVMIQEKRGLFKHWNMFLIILTYALVIFGTFLTRSGVLSSVHAFANSPIGPFFMGFVSATLVASFALLIYRWPDLRSETELKSMLSREALFLLNNFLFILVLIVCFIGVVFPLASELFTGEKVTVGPAWYERINSGLFAIMMLLMAVAPLSAWGLSSADNMGRVKLPVLGAILAVPVIAAAVFWQPLKNSLGGMVNTVIVIAVILIILAFLYMFRRAVWQATVVASLVTILLAITYTPNIIALVGFFLVALTLTATFREFWRAARARQDAHGENFFEALGRLTARNPRRYGGYVIHISMMLMAIGIMGIEIFQVETQGTVPVDGRMQVGGYTVEYDEIARFAGPDQREVTRAVVSLYDSQGTYLGQLYPRIDFYADAQQNMTIPGQRSTLKDDVYVLLVDWQPASPLGATFKIFINPLVNWLWIGSLVFLLGIIIAAWPRKEPEYVAASVKGPVLQPNSAD